MESHAASTRPTQGTQPTQRSQLAQGNQPTQGTQPAEGTQPTQGQQTETQPQEGEQAPPKEATKNKRKPSRPPSDAWQHFTKVENDTKAACNYCQQTYACNTATHGTSNLLKHLKTCEKSPFRQIDKKQKTLCFGKQSEDDNSVSFKLVEFNQEKTRLALAKMIIIDELPFKFVENQGFKDFMAEAQPRFKIPSRITLARDCMLLYSIEKEKLKIILSANSQMVSLTTDTWTSIQNMNYMCVTAHYIDDGWVLNKKILHFGLIADHKGDTIGKSLERCLKEWGITIVCCVTVDNASANSVAISYLIRSMSDWNGNTLLAGDFMHMRCAAHILNLIVTDGLKEIDSSVNKIRAACKFVRSSPARLTTFKRCAKEASISCEASVSLDVSTRWNSTYLMLDVAEKFEKAFKRLEYDDSQYLVALANEGGCPNSDDWSRARMFVKVLKIFYDATLTFSGSLYVTSNMFFKTLVDIQKSLNKWRKSRDEVLQKMTTNMQIKFSKYWEGSEINYLLLVAVFLDPRYKLEYVDFCFVRMYGQDRSEELLKKLKDILYKLFEYYAASYPLGVDGSDSSSIASNLASQSDTPNDDGDDEDWGDEFRTQIRKKQHEVKKNELERYLEDDIEDSNPNDEFEILKWWKGKSMKYYILSRMARDILAVPVSTVSSESAFSTGGRVLDPFRSSLSPSTVEALICAQNWLRTAPKVIELQDEMDQIQKIESELSGLHINDGGATTAAAPRFNKSSKPTC